MIPPVPLHLPAFATLLAQWQSAFDRRDLAQIASLFAEDVLFQGFGPQPLQGREAVRAYYARVPHGVRATVQVLQVLDLGADAVAGFADVAFVEGARSRPVRLSVTAQRLDGRWQIRLYHVSAQP